MQESLESWLIAWYPQDPQPGFLAPLRVHIPPSLISFRPEGPYASLPSSPVHCLLELLQEFLGLPSPSRWSLRATLLAPHLSWALSKSCHCDTYSTLLWGNLSFTILSRVVNWEKQPHGMGWEALGLGERIGKWQRAGPQCSWIPKEVRSVSKGLKDEPPSPSLCLWIRAKTDWENCTGRVDSLVNSAAGALRLSDKPCV